MNRLRGWDRFFNLDSSVKDHFYCFFEASDNLPDPDVIALEINRMRIAELNSKELKTPTLKQSSST